MVVHLQAECCCADYAAPPKVLHYGLIYTIANTNYTFDKHWHYDFDATACPPWDMTTDHPKRGMFPHPPRASSFATRVSQPLKLSTICLYPEQFWVTFKVMQRLYGS